MGKVCAHTAGRDRPSHWDHLNTEDKESETFSITSYLYNTPASTGGASNLLSESHSRLD